MELDHRASLDTLLSQPDRELAQLEAQDQKVELERRALRKKLYELAQGLIGSEYWELVSMILIDGLECAKSALESESTDDRRLRLCQGEAKAYRSAYNMIVDMAKGGD
jgi:hypothetical protein